MSKLLINEPPLQVLPSLAEKIGLNEAIVLQQIHYWLHRSTNVVEDAEGVKRRWVYKSISEWQDELSFWSKSTIKRTLRSLKDDDLIIAEQKKKDEGDMTVWYSIRYATLEEITSDPPDQDDPPSGQDEHPHSVKMNEGGGQDESFRARGTTRPRTEITQENTQRERARAGELTHDEKDEPPCSLQEAIETGKKCGVSEELCREWWLHYDARGWPFHVRKVASALKKWKIDDRKYNGEMSGDGEPARDDDGNVKINPRTGKPIQK